MEIEPGTLTPRQLEVAELVAAGLTSKQIAAALGVSFKTVECHRQNIYRRLGIGNVTELVRWVLEREQG